VTAPHLRYGWYGTLQAIPLVAVCERDAIARLAGKDRWRVGSGDQLAIGERTEGPLFVAADGRRLDRHAAGRVVRRTVRRAGIAKLITRTRCGTRSSPPRSTRASRCATSRKPPRRHATYIVSGYLAGAAR
jgi:hypothetical protein